MSRRFFAHRKEISPRTSFKRNNNKKLAKISPNIIYALYILICGANFSTEESFYRVSVRFDRNFFGV